MSDNLIVLYGRFTRDPEYTPAQGDKSQYAKFTVAVNRTRGSEADFFDCIVFGKRADVIREFFTKGKEIRIQGRHECDPYLGRDGKRRYPWTVKVDDFGFCGSKDKASGQDVPQPDAQEAFKEAEEDIPF